MNFPIATTRVACGGGSGAFGEFSVILNKLEFNPFKRGHSRNRANTKHNRLASFSALHFRNSCGSCFSEKSPISGKYEIADAAYTCWRCGLKITDYLKCLLLGWPTKWPEKWPDNFSMFTAQNWYPERHFRSGKQIKASPLPVIRRDRRHRERAASLLGIN